MDANCGSSSGRRTPRDRDASTQRDALLGAKGQSRGGRHALAAQAKLKQGARLYALGDILVAQRESGTTFFRTDGEMLDELGSITEVARHPLAFEGRILARNADSKPIAIEL